jgi:predicted site-specific integrase-resolvase
MSKREQAMAWWNLLTMEEKMRYTRLIFSYPRQYTSLTGREIESVMAAAERDKMRRKIIEELTSYPLRYSYEMLKKASETLGIFPQEKGSPKPPYTIE